MSTGPIGDEYHRDHMRAATRILAIVDRNIDGEAGGDISLADLGWLRAMLLDAIETDESALGLDHSQTCESVLRTIRLGMTAGLGATTA